MDSGILYGMVTSASSSNYTEYAIRSFFKNTTLGHNDLFVLVDNDAVWPSHTSAFINLVKNESPKTFSQNVNYLIELADRLNKDLVFLSNDVILTPDWNSKLIIENVLTIPSCNQTHEYFLPPNTSLEEYDNRYNLLCDTVTQHRRLVTNDSFEKLLMPFYAFSLPKSVYRKIGYFDDGFVNGGEDLDYRVRCILNDVPVKYISNSYVLHFNGKSTWRSVEDQQAIEERNKKYKIRFAEKWGTDLLNIMALGGDPNGVLMKHNLMHFDSTVHSYNSLIKIIYDKTNISNGITR